MVYKGRKVWRGIENALIKNRFNYISLYYFVSKFLGIAISYSFSAYD